MSEFNAVSMDELNQVEGGFDWGLAAAVTAGWVLGGAAGAAVTATSYEITKAAS